MTNSRSASSQVTGAFARLLDALYVPVRVRSVADRSAHTNARISVIAAVLTSRRYDGQVKIAVPFACHYGRSARAPDGHSRTLVCAGQDVSVHERLGFPS